MRPKVSRTAQAVRFLQVSRLLLWTMWIMYRERRRVIREYTSSNYAARPDSDALIEAVTVFCLQARKLGILMIKLGQFLSSRIDMLPERAIIILSSLQDDVPPAPFEHIKYVVESELGRPVEEVFSSLEETCTAAASLGQIHKAVLASTGEAVALKIQRPHADQLIRTDLKALKCVIWIISRLVSLNGFIDLPGIFQEFERTIYEEIDYVREAANARRFKEMFKDNPHIYVPRVYEQYASRRLLVLEWIEGMKINDYDALDASGVNRLEVVRHTMCAYFYQLFEAGFFHADPHPGNIFVKKGSEDADPVIAFVDFGMMGSHTTTMKKSLRTAFLALLARDSCLLVDALAKLGFIGRDADIPSIERSLSIMMERYYSVTLGEISKVDIVEMVQDAAHLLYGQPFHIPAQFAFTGRAISTLLGVSTGLAPDFNVVEVAIPYAQKFLGLDAQGVEQALWQFFGQLVETGKALLTLPRTLEQVIAKFEREQFDLARDGQRLMGGRRGMRARDGLSGNAGLVWPVMFVVPLVCGIFLLANAHLPVAGWFCLILAGLTMLKLLVKS